MATDAREKAWEKYKRDLSHTVQPGAYFFDMGRKELDALLDDIETMRELGFVKADVKHDDMCCGFDANGNVLHISPSAVAEWLGDELCGATYMADARESDGTYMYPKLRALLDSCCVEDDTDA